MLRGAVLFLVASIAVMQAYPALATDPLERTQLEHPRLVNALGNQVGNKISVNQQVHITSDVKNNQEQSQQFIYIVQVKDASQRIVSLDWFVGNLNANQVFSPALSWTPQSGGEYSAEIFVWDSFKRQSPLSQPAILQITVS